MKKYIVILLLTILILTGCSKKNDLPESVISAQDNLISRIGVSTKTKLILKKVEKNYTLYEVFTTNNKVYDQISYFIYNNEEDYKASLETYADTYYNLEKFSSAYSIKINANMNVQTSIDAYTKIKEKYKDNKEYEIVE